MNLIEGVAVSNHCDYSFGDQSGCIGNVAGAYMKQADPCNTEFADLVKGGKPFMTVFIDNIRLYNRPLKADTCLLYTSPSPRDVEESRMPSSA